MLLNAYEWPGNVRELEHCIERAVIMSEGVDVTEADLPPHILIWKEMGGNGSGSGRTARGGLAQTVREAERRTLLAALERSGWVQARAARTLGISERSMWYRVKKLGLERPPH
jgi:two-component system NtrC family response regulator